MAAPAQQQEGQQQTEEYELTEQELDSMISEALDCPCVKDLRDGPCGKAFEAAFTCFHKSIGVPKGQDCLAANTAFTACLQQHPEALVSLQAAGEEGGLTLPPGPPDNHFTRVPAASS